MIALVGPVGALLWETAEELEVALAKYSYEVVRVRLSAALQHVGGSVVKEAADEIKTESYFDGLGKEYDRIRHAMARGTFARKQYLGEHAKDDDKNSCLGELAVSAISAHRRNMPYGVCYIVHSIKTKSELRVLRKVYGRRLLVLGVHSSRASRQNRLAARIQRDSGRTPKASEAALHLIGIDEKERGTKFGQSVQAVFERCDVYISAEREDEDFRLQVDRLVRLIFVEPFEVPTPDESAMAYAYGASLRSASMARQVGAAIVNGSGDLLAVGFNEAPTVTGTHSAASEVDGRDRAKGYDQSAIQKRALLAQVIATAQECNLLAADKTADEAVLALEEFARSRDMLWMNTTEFVREVHAEMSAITTAARLGTGVKGATLFTTTFPCHNCAKHIVASGIDEVVFVEAYPKSLAEEFYGESLAFDEPRPGKVLVRAFRGVAPRAYTTLFAWRERRDQTGLVTRGSPRESQPWFARRTHLSNDEVSQREAKVVIRKRELGDVFKLDAALKELSGKPVAVRSAQRELFDSDAWNDGGPLQAETRSG